MITIDSVVPTLARLPPDLRQEALEYIEYLVAQVDLTDLPVLKFDWAGSLSDLKDQYTSVELQHKALEWRN
jgi:hypothetical protein